MLQVGQSSFNAIRRNLNGLDRRARLRCRGLGEGVLSVDKSVSASATFDFAKTDEVAALEVPVTVLEFPERCFGITGMKYVSF